MNLKHSIACFICLILLAGIIGSGCAKKGVETIKNSNQNINGQEVQEDTAAETVKPNEEPSTEVASKDNSPWKLISESSVETAVNYAGFLNESIGVTVGYEGAISYTEDGGKNWSQSSNKSACRYGLDFNDESFIVNSGNSGVNLISTDKGRNWPSLGDFPLKDSSAYNKFLSAVDSKNIYVGSMKSLGVSNDGGLTWEELKVP